MATKQKEEEIKVRVTKQMKEAVQVLAERRGESESLIVREAIMAYLDRANRPPTEAEELEEARRRTARQHEWHRQHELQAPTDDSAEENRTKKIADGRKARKQ